MDNSLTIIVAVFLGFVIGYLIALLVVVTRMPWHDINGISMIDPMRWESYTIPDEEQPEENEDE